MKPDLARALDGLGQLAHVHQLAAAGHSSRVVARAVASGRLHRVCRGWVATPLARRSAIAAVLHRGKLTGTAALASYKVWDGCDKRLHIHRRRNCHGEPRHPLTPLSTFGPDEHPRSGVRLHWLNERFPNWRGPAWRVSVKDALIRAAHDVSEEQFVACLDSALNTRVLSLAELPDVFSSLPRRFRRLRWLVNHLAESGLESLARLRLAGIAERIEVQVRIDGINRYGGEGRVDLLLDGWLVIELDGDKFHDQFVDRKRTTILVRKGYRLHRFGYHDVIHDWENTAATVRELLRTRP